MKILTLITAIAISFCATDALAKPMNTASLDEAARSPYVVLASYQGHEPLVGRSNEDIYMSGFMADFQIESVLKQPSLGATKNTDPAFKPGENFNVRYLVHDLSPCMADQSFRFTESLMPTKKSKWILFLSTNNDKNGWQTYRGNAGRLEASKSKVSKVKSLLTAALRN
ncbi:MAG: hypothetical protein SGJ27_02170 [Candidatus Melainabacteria bacterium]|nr:hypothetical protein [Candidatus Melainabacteria bacterium]